MCTFQLLGGKYWLVVITMFWLVQNTDDKAQGPTQIKISEEITGNPAQIFPFGLNWPEHIVLKSSAQE